MSETEARAGQARSEEWDPEQAWAPVRRGEASAHDVYAEQRSRCPVSFARQDNGQGVWHAFRARDVAAVLTDWETFSSAMSQFGQPLVPIETDPPEHTVYRGLLGKMMAPRRLVQYEAVVREFIVARLGPILTAGGGDLMPILHELPMRTFCQLVGDEDARFDEFDQARRKGSPSPQRTDAEAAAIRAALMEPLREYCRARLRKRRAQPADDLATDIANATIDGEPLDEDIAANMLSLIYIAGHGTTTSGMQAAVVCLARDPQAQDALRREPRKIPAAIEEALRLESPFQAGPRYCTRDTELGGREVRAGDQVYPVYAAANLDPELFPDPEVFDIERKPNHFAFGRGVHSCVGAPLARMQIRVLLEELLTGTTRFRLAEPLRRVAWPHYRAERVMLECEREKAA